MKICIIVIGFFLTITPSLADDRLLPDPILTPGISANPPIPLTILCKTGYTAQPGIRHVSKRMKDAVFKEYRYDPQTVNKGSFEIDHLISLELGGTNDIRNLWPQSYTTSLNAHHKDVLENYLKRNVCSGRMNLSVAQKMIASDWISAYKILILHGGIIPAYNRTTNKR